MHRQFGAEPDRRSRVERAGRGAVSAHWGWPDPAAEVEPAECRAVFARTLAAIEQAMTELLELPLGPLSSTAFTARLDLIGAHIA